MKRILSLALLFLFLFNVAGYYFLFLMLVPANRNEMRNTLLQHTSLETIRIHKSKLHTVSFKDGGREILYHGEMYDVKSRSEKGDYILFTCKHDSKETKLLAGLNKYAKSNSSSNTADKKQNDKNPVKDLFFHENRIILNESVAFYFPSALCHFTSYLSPVLPPPPDRV